MYTIAAFSSARGLSAVFREKGKRRAHAPTVKIPIDILVGNARLFVRMT